MSKKIKVGLIGVGNCASSLVQGIHYYSDIEAGSEARGLANASLGGWLPRDIEVVAAFDVNKNKLGRDVSEAIYQEPNNTIRFCDVPHLGVPVSSAPVFDGVGNSSNSAFDSLDGDGTGIAKILRDQGVEILVNYLPVGSETATRWWAELAIEAGCAFINCIPVFIASDPEWAERFQQAGLPVIGDDIKSQFGATILHRMLVKMMGDRGIHLDNSYQLNFGGNMDFRNMLENSRLSSKRQSKTNAVLNELSEGSKDCQIHVSPSDYVPFLEDQKIAYVRAEGCNFGGAPISLEVRLQIWDSPNSAGVVIDAIRAAKVALSRGESGPIKAPSAWMMKHPPNNLTDERAATDFGVWLKAKI